MKPVRPLRPCAGAGTPRRPNLGNLREVPITPLGDYHSPLLCWNSGRQSLVTETAALTSDTHARRTRLRLAEAIRPCAVVTATVRVSLRKLADGRFGAMLQCSIRGADRPLRADLASGKSGATVRAWPGESMRSISDNRHKVGNNLVHAFGRSVEGKFVRHRWTEARHLVLRNLVPDWQYSRPTRRFQLK